MIRKIAGCLCLILIVSTFTGCFKLDPDKEFDKMYDVVSGSGSFSEAKKAYENFQTKLNKEYEKLGQKEHEKGMSEDDLALFKDIQRVLSNGGDLYPEFMAKGEALGSLEEKREASVWIQNHTYWGGPELAVILDGRTYYEMRYSGEDEVVDLSRVERRLGEDGLEFTLNPGGAMPCTVRLTLTGDNASYTRLYLYNEATGQWQYLNSYADGVITTDTAGRYLLTNETLTFVQMNVYALAAAGVVLLAIIAVYIAVKKRYWFW